MWSYFLYEHWIWREKGAFSCDLLSLCLPISFIYFFIPLSFFSVSIFSLSHCCPFIGYTALPNFLSHTKTFMSIFGSFWTSLLRPWTAWVGESEFLPHVISNFYFILEIMYLLSFLQVGKDILNSPFDFLYLHDVQQKESLKMLFFFKNQYIFLIGNWYHSLCQLKGPTQHILS